MSGFSIDLSDLVERYPLSTGSYNTSNTNTGYAHTSTNSNSNSGSSMFGKLWSGFTGLFSRKSATQTVTNSTPVTSAPIRNDQTNSNFNNTNQSAGSTLGQTTSNNNNYSASTTSKLSSKSMDAMLLLQEAAGNWKLHQHLAKLLNIDWTALESAKPKEVNDDAWMTLVCVAYLHNICSQHKSEWELIVQKAENWLKTVGANKSEWNQRARQLIQQSV